MRTTRKIERRDITREVRGAASELGVEADGALLVSLPHTTAAVSVGEAWDPDVTGDIERALEAWVPGVRFDHGEGNSPAHIKASLVGSSQTVFVESGRLVLGTWQGIFLCEFDGPRRRKVCVKVARI